MTIVHLILQDRSLRPAVIRVSHERWARVSAAEPRESSEKEGTRPISFAVVTFVEAFQTAARRG